MIFLWVDFNDINLRPKPKNGECKGNHPQMVLIQVSDLVQFTQMYDRCANLGEILSGMSMGYTVTDI